MQDAEWLTMQLFKLTPSVSDRWGTPTWHILTHACVNNLHDQGASGIVAHIAAWTLTDTGCALSF